MAYGQLGQPPARSDVQSYHRDALQVWRRSGIQDVLDNVIDHSLMLAGPTCLLNSTQVMRDIAIVLQEAFGLRRKLLKMSQNKLAQFLELREV